MGIRSVKIRFTFSVFLILVIFPFLSFYLLVIKACPVLHYRYYLYFRLSSRDHLVTYIFLLSNSLVYNFSPFYVSSLSSFPFLFIIRFRSISSFFPLLHSPLYSFSSPIFLLDFLPLPPFSIITLFSPPVSPPSPSLTPLESLISPPRPFLFSPNPGEIPLEVPLNPLDRTGVSPRVRHFPGTSPAFFPGGHLSPKRVSLGALSAVGRGGLTPKSAGGGQGRREKERERKKNDERREGKAGGTK